MKTNALFYLLTIILFCSCSKTDTTPKPPDLNIKEMNINVLLYGEDDQFKLFQWGGMTITVENADPLISGVTNDSGYCRLLSLDKLPGNFALVYTKSGYGTFKNYYQYTTKGLVAVDDPNNDVYLAPVFLGATLGAKSTVTVNSFSIVRNDTATVISCNISSPNIQGKKYIRLFYQKNIPDFNFETVPKIINKTFGEVIPVENGNNVIKICTECWKACAGYKTGDIVYVTAYGDSWVGNRYTDIVTGKLMMPNVNTSNHVKPVKYIIP